MDAFELPSVEEILAFLRVCYDVETDEDVFVRVFGEHHISEPRDQYRAFRQGVTIYLPPCIQREFMVRKSSS